MRELTLEEQLVIRELAREGLKSLERRRAAIASPPAPLPRPGMNPWAVVLLCGL